MGRKYYISVKYADGSSREYISAQPLNRNIQICKNEANVVWFKIEPTGQSGANESLIREFTLVNNSWVQ